LQLLLPTITTKMYLMSLVIFFTHFKKTLTNSGKLQEPRAKSSSAKACKKWTWKCILGRFVLAAFAVLFCRQSSNQSNNLAIQKARERGNWKLELPPRGEHAMLMVRSSHSSFFRLNLARRLLAAKVGRKRQNPKSKIQKPEHNREAKRERAKTGNNRAPRCYVIVFGPLPLLLLSSPLFLPLFLSDPFASNNCPKSDQWSTTWLDIYHSGLGFCWFFAYGTWGFMITTHWQLHKYHKTHKKIRIWHWVHATTWTCRN